MLAPWSRAGNFWANSSGDSERACRLSALSRFATGKVRAAYAEVGRDAKPYSYRSALEFKTTSYGGYGYSFWGPNLKLKPEFAKSWEFGTELGWLQDRLGLDATYYSKRTFDQIVQNVRGSYGTGFILFNLNGASTKNAGVELTLRGTPVRRAVSWDIVANFDKSRGNRAAQFAHADSFFFPAGRGGKRWKNFWRFFFC